ncbi:NAD-dependent epimerase/dehydratase family protein [Spirosoma taeanense]|uniref:NAD-dependent epimerase/dehydratase family protein n=1 Tax=Spirosoma taeanense TaxID=2735870 RepID=A0A6M5Y612_9BACT|nr:NAD-dependent epimerase/dehydratase family protein [Spirosoma taeanense]QJW88493.1 NAD-dependent epimerase/dehydratase family protein [Spirosoma taeanense]
MTILLTGAAGFIGSHLTRQLLAAGHVVIGLDNFDDQYDPALKRQAIRPFIRLANYRLVTGDIRDQALLAEVLSQYRCDTVVHLAARTGVRASVHEPALCIDVNVTGTLALLEAMRVSNVRRLVLASSSSVYGNSSFVPFREDDEANGPLSPYAMSKRSAELLAHTYHHLYGFDVACLRFFTVYGPRQRPEMAISKFTARLLDGKPITLYGDGSTTRNYTYVQDTVTGIIQAIHHLGGFDLLNIGGMASISLSELVHLIEQAVGQRAIINWQPAQPGDAQSTCADLRQAQARIGYYPSVSIKEGIGRFINWYKKQALNQPIV